MPQTKEEIAAYRKKWAQQNKDKRAAANKKYYEKNKEQVAAQQKEYAQTPAGQKTEKIANWKHQGMIADDWDIVYQTFIDTTCCNFCCNEFKNSLDKHLDHDHETGQIRGVLCRSCNTKDVYAT